MRREERRAQGARIRLTAGRFLAGVGTLLLLVASWAAPEPSVGFFGKALTTFLSEALWVTVATVWLVTVIESELKAIKIPERLTAGADEGRLRLALWLLPTVLGFIPAAAGAKLSAGVVAQAGSRTDADSPTLAAVNFWFRHAFVFCNPLIPGTVLAAGVARVPTADLVLYGLPASAAAVLAGLFFLVRRIGFEAVPGRSDDGESKGVADAGALSVEAGGIPWASRIFLGVLVLSVLCAFLSDVPLPVLLGLPAICGALAVGRSGEGGVRRISDVLRVFLPDGRNARLLTEIALLLWFAATLRASGLAEAVPSLLGALPLPPLVGLAVLAFLLSLLTGVSVSSVAVTMPLVAELCPGDASAAYLIVASGFVAQFLTPTHLCLTVSAEHFGTDAVRVVGRILPALIVTAVVACLPVLGLL